MKRSDLLAICLAIFSMFLGAGNIIFPPMVGQLAGDNILQGGMGFMMGDVGLTLVTLIGVALAGGPDKVTQYLPGWAAKLFWIALFAVMGPAFVVPRTAHVAYEMGLMSFLESPGEAVRTLYTILFLAIACYFALTPHRMVSSVGKLMAPLLLLILTAIAIGTFYSPQGTIQAASGAYVDQAFSEGMVQGYLTMDALGPLCLGWMIAQVLREHGVKSENQIVRYSAVVGLFAAVGMGLVYSAMLYLGATSHSVAPEATNGAQILTAYVTALFGTTGSVIMGGVITLACLTTAIGTPGACAQYFHSIAPKRSYRWYVVAIYLVAIAVATMGLDLLIKVSIPVMVIIYPVAIVLTITAVLQKKLSNPVTVTRLTALSTVLFASLDGWKASGMMPESIEAALANYLPLFAQNMGWLIPSVLAMVIGIVISEVTGARTARAVCS